MIRSITTNQPRSGSWRTWLICLALAARTGTGPSNGMPGSAGACLKAGTIDRIRYIFAPSYTNSIEYEFVYISRHAGFHQEFEVLGELGSAKGATPSRLGR